MAEARRSGRRRKVNPKYANDGWDKEILRVLRESSESSRSGAVEDLASSESEESENLNDASAQEEVDDDDTASLASAAPVQSSNIETPDEEEDDDISLASDDDMPAGERLRQRPRPFSATTSQTARSRGVQLPRELRKRASYPNTFGPGVDDLVDVLQARDTWLRGRDITIPSRQTLSVATEHSKALHATLVNNDENAASQDPRHFPSSSFYVLLHKNQILKTIERDELCGKYLLSRNPPHSIVFGPWGKQEKNELNYLSVLDLGKVWPKEKAQSKEIMQTEELPAASRYHQGWLFNVGEKVQCLAWTSGPGPVQYLAVAVKCTSEQRQMALPGESERPAFHPSPSYPSSIQIWAFQTRDTGEQGIRTLAMNHEPRLAVVLATEWGNIRQLRWCPLDQVADTGSEVGSDGSTIGLLGVVSSDGHARVFTVPHASNREGAGTIALRVERPGLDFPPPGDTIFTTLAFPTPTDLMLGTADGLMHLYDLSEPKSQGVTPKSYIQQQLHHTYIISLCSASPGPHATLVASVSASGDLVLTDLRSPEQDRIHVPRSCFPNRDLIYSPFTRSFIAVLDRSGNSQTERNAATFLVCHHVRQFPNLLKLAKLPHQNGAATALAGSHWHPCILVGNAKGQVLATNYLRKVLPYRRTDHRKAVGAYLQKICEYNWRPLTQQELGQDASSSPHETREKEEIDLYYGRDVRPGISRFHEGFKPEKIEVGNFQPSTKKAKKTKTDDMGSGKPCSKKSSLSLRLSGIRKQSVQAL